LPIPVAKLFKVRVYGRSRVGVAGLNSAGGMDVCVLCVVQQGQKAKSGQSGQRSTDKIERTKRIPPVGSIFVSCECCVMSGTGPCDGPIPRPEETYRLWCVILCDLQTSRMRRPWIAWGCRARKKGLHLSTHEHVCENPDVSACVFLIFAYENIECSTSVNNE
jgi:hypothetical protein